MEAPTAATRRSARRTTDSMFRAPLASLGRPRPGLDLAIPSRRRAPWMSCAEGVASCGASGVGRGVYVNGAFTESGPGGRGDARERRSLRRGEGLPALTAYRAVNAGRGATIRSTDRR